MSHSSQDKSRFVIHFAERLREAGVNVWLDDWELLPGDSLIDRIFAEGIAKSDVVIVVLSANTGESNWVKNELNTAAIQKIEGNCRLIPVVLDDAEVPSVLRDIVYQRISDHYSYDTEFQRILDGIHNQPSQPSIGEPPIYIREDQASYGDGLQAGSRLILMEMLKRGADDGGTSFDNDDMECIRRDGEMSEHQFRKEMARLEQNRHIEVRRYLGGGMNCRLMPSGVVLGLSASGFDVDSAWNQIGACIVNSTHDGSEQSVCDIAEETGQSALLVDSLVSIWEQRGHLEVTRAFGGFRATRIWRVDPLFEDVLL